MIIFKISKVYKTFIYRIGKRKIERRLFKVEIEYREFKEKV